MRRTVKVDGRIGDIFALQDKIVFELSQGLNLALRGTEIADIERRETQSVEAYESYARGMMNLRLATRDSIERAIVAFEDATRHDPEYAMAWAALGGAYGSRARSSASATWSQRAIEMERRALSIDPELADAHGWLGDGAAHPRPDRRSDCRRSTRRSGSSPRTARRTRRSARALVGRQGRLRRRDSRCSSRAIELNPEAGYSYLQLGAAAGVGRPVRARPRTSAAAPSNSRISTFPATPACRSSARNSRLGYVYYLQGRYEEAHPRVRARAGVRRRRAITRSRNAR